MTAPAELFMTVVATAVIILGTAIVFGRHFRPYQQPRLPEPTTPEPKTPEPKTPEPKTPEPKAPEPKTPEPKAPEPKSLTFRVNGIPIDHADKFEATLKSITEQIPVLRKATDSIICRSLARKNNGFSCATVSITTSLPADELSARLNRFGGSPRYSYSCKFYGITPLYDGKDDADVDVIAVPGLGSHALGSWKSPNSDDVWLRDFLAEDVPKIRVLLYGYDTTLANSQVKQSIEDLAATFLEQVIAFRAEDEVRVPNAVLDSLN
ncbi:hypothetical protein MCOR14_009448 [Pyricularia oryzae]|nr:hypothetical protein MCOR14_009448 [Pyricularia oryzae]